MKLLNSYKDNLYPFKGISHNRLISRAFIINENNDIFFEFITRDDEFGNASYIESPGGGVNKNESLNDAVIREVKEECGLIVEVIKEIGTVEDEFNLIGRHNITNYFLCKIIGQTSMNREEYETHWIKDMRFIPFQEVKNILENPTTDISSLIYRRELTALNELEKIL